MSIGLFTNSSSRRDFVKTGLLESAGTVTDIFIAAAFFTEFEALGGVGYGQCDSSPHCATRIPD